MGNDNYFLARNLKPESCSKQHQLIAISNLGSQLIRADKFKNHNSNNLLFES
jgi:hypothetical protein